MVDNRNQDAEFIRIIERLKNSTTSLPVSDRGWEIWRNIQRAWICPALTL